METTRKTESLLSQLDIAMTQKEATLIEFTAARNIDMLAWDKVQAIVRQMDLPQGQTVAGRWIISKNADPSSRPQVSRALIFGQIDTNEQIFR